MSFGTPEHEKYSSYKYTTFEKIVTLAKQVIEKLKNGTLDLDSFHIIEALESFHRTGSIDSDILKEYQNGIIDIPTALFLILQSYLEKDFVLEDTTPAPINPHTQRSIVFRYYETLGNCIGRTVNQDLSGVKLLSDQRNFGKTNAIEKLRHSISDEVLSKVKAEGEIDRNLLEAMFDAFEVDEKIFDRYELLFFLERGGFISKKEKRQLHEIGDHSLFIFEVSKIFEEKIVDTCKLKQEDEFTFYTHLRAFQATEGQSFFHNPEENETLQLLYCMLSGVLDSLRSDNTGESLDSEILDRIIDILEEYLPMPSYYLVHVIGKKSRIGPHAKGMRFDELKDLPLAFDKAILILGIVVCDIMEASHPLFEEASDLVLCNTSSNSNHAAIKKIIEEKTAIEFRAATEKGATSTKNEENDAMMEEVILSNAKEMIDWILEGETQNITHEYLDEFIDFLEGFLDDESAYCELFGKNFSELREISEVFQKAIQILCIIFCDMVDSSFSHYDELYNILMENIDSEETKSILKNIFCRNQEASGK